MPTSKKEQLLKSIGERVDEAFGYIDKSGLGEDIREGIKDEVAGEVETFMRRTFDHSVKKKTHVAHTEQLKLEIDRQETILRFSLFFRIQHIIMFVSVLLLVFTGLPLKFNETAVAKMIFSSADAFMFAKMLHRIAATALAGVALVHLYFIVFMKEGRSNFIQFLPRFQDAKDALHNIKYFIGLEKHHPRFDRFSYIEKFDYWAVYWGIIVMVGSGSALWFNTQFMALLPKYMIDVMKEVHSDEALLATLALVIWHFYNVHFNPSKFPGSLLWWHGRMTVEEMKDEHPLEYERIISERAEKKLEAQVQDSGRNDSRSGEQS